MRNLQTRLQPVLFILLLLSMVTGLVFPASAAALNSIYLPIISQGCGSVCPYYVSSSTGSDSNSGLDPSQPFKTLAKVNSLAFKPGDQILFKCGDVWRGGILAITRPGAAGKPITYSSYPAGCLNQPRLDGTQPVTGWSIYAANIYVADLAVGNNQPLFKAADGTPLGINQLFQRGARLTMGRWPNLDAGDGGYSTVDSQPGSNSLTDAELPAKNWTGATIHLKVIRWSMINRDVTAASGKTLTLNSSLGCWGNSCTGWGYFINNSLNTLDQDGEWYYDKNARKVYLFSTGNPNLASIEASVVYQTGDRNWGAVYLGKDSADPVHDIVVDNFDIRGWFMNGISSPTNLHPDENSSLTLRNNTIRDLDGSGINLWSWVWGASDGNDGWRGGHNILIQGNRIDGANSFGIHTPSRDTTIEYNTIQNIGLISNLNEAGMGCGKTGNEGQCTEDGAGLRIYVDNPSRSGYGFIVHYNRFEQIGYNGIQMFGGTSTFNNNYFDHTCVSKGDGGAINTFGGGSLASTNVHDIQILNNIILNTIGNTDGTQSGFRPLFGFGIYLDNSSANITTRGNSIANSTAAGILYQNTTGSIENNILFQNVAGSGWTSQVVLTGSQTAVSAFTGNIMVSTNNHSHNLALDSLGMLAAADHNWYFHSLNLGMQVIVNGSEKGLAQWIAYSQKDKSSNDGTPAYAATLQLYTNETNADKTISSLTGTFQNLDKNSLGASFVLPPYTSVVVAFIPN